MGEAFTSLPLQKRTPFLASTGDYGASGAVILGAPMDWTCSFRPGSRFGPAAIREVSEGIEEYSIYCGRSLDDFDFYDAGDLVLPFGDVAGSLALIERAGDALFAEGKFPVLLGGEHLVSYPAIKACHKLFPELRVLHFDAHADLRAAYCGQELSHASVMRLVHGILGDGRIHQCGIRSGARDEFAFAAEHTRWHRGGLEAAMREAARELAGFPVYLSIDIDVLDPAFAPGTGTPECAGATSAELLQLFPVFRELDIVGFDLVEVSPGADPSARTPLLAAVLVREALLMQGGRGI